MRLRFVFTFVVIFMLGQGCSVFMAANQPSKKDVSVFNVGTPRARVIAEAGQPVHTKENADGTITDTFSFIQGYSSGNKAGRALFHGAADVLTLGLWEVVGTPVEAIATGTKVQVEVQYDADEKVRTAIALSGGNEFTAVHTTGSAGKQVQQAATDTQSNEPEGGQKLAAVTQDAPITMVGLRREPARVSNRSDISKMLVQYNFFELGRNTQGSFVNDFVDNNDGTVTDKATGLMWQKSGSLERLDNSGASDFIQQLNSKNFVGYYDWRMPTIEELASLLTRSRNKGVYIAPVFDSHQTSCWSADKSAAQQSWNDAYWIVNFEQGQVLEAEFRKPPTTANFSAYDIKNETNYVKAVRSVR